MLAGLAANATSSFQRANENDQAADSSKKVMISPVISTGSDGALYARQFEKGDLHVKYEKFAGTWKSLPPIGRTLY